MIAPAEPHTGPRVRSAPAHFAGAQKGAEARRERAASNPPLKLAWAAAAGYALGLDWGVSLVFWFVLCGVKTARPESMERTGQFVHRVSGGMLRRKLNG